MRSSVEPLEGNKVKLSIEVDEDEFEKALDAAFKKMANEVRIPGFRPGKAPRRILEARLGSEVARREALREALPEYYVRGLRQTEVDAIGEPEFDLTSGQESGPVAFNAVVEVRPSVAIPGYAGLQVTIPSPAVTEEEVDAQLDKLRAGDATLADVERPATKGDVVRIDLKTTAGDQVEDDLTDYSYEVGSGSGFPPEVDAHLQGAKLGDILEFGAAVGGRQLTFRVFVKQIQEKVLPEPTDEWVADNSEFDTLAELRADLRKNLEVVKRVHALNAIREAALEALVDLVDDEPPEVLVQAEVDRRLQQVSHSLHESGLDVSTYLSAVGMSAQDLVDEARRAATRAVKADLALRSLADLEDIEVTEDDVDKEIERLAPQVKRTPQQLRRELERAEQVQAVRSDVKKAKALEWLVDHVEPVDPEGKPIDRAALQAPAATETDEEQE